MSSNVYGASAYQQSITAWQRSDAGRSVRTTSWEMIRTDDVPNAKTDPPEVKTSTWSAQSVTNSMIPTRHETYGKTIGDVKLSDGASEYYNKLKSKFHNLDFVLVSKDMKSQVQQNAAQYGNANRMVVLIDEEKLERMATDESYRKKYEGIISMAQPQLAAMKSKLASSGTNVKNFGMSVDSNGKQSFFAVLDEASAAQKERIEKKTAEHREAKKAAARKAEAKRAEKAAEKKKAEKAARKAAEEQSAEQVKEESADPAGKAKNAEVIDAEEHFVEYRASSLQALLRKVSDAAYEKVSASVRTEQERQVGQSFDFRG